jgi:hypothetical protein
MTACSVKDCPRPAVLRPLVKVWAKLTPVAQRTDQNCALLEPDLPHCRECWATLTPSHPLITSLVAAGDDMLRKLGKAPFDLTSVKIAFEHVLP